MSSGAALILANGPIPRRAALDAAWPGWSSGIDHVVAADGGARHGARLGFRIDRWVGDGDSISTALLQRLEAAGVPLDRSASDKDESDAELAVLAAIRAGAESIVLLGGLGGPRLDHELANLWLLGHPALDGRPAVAYDEHAIRVTLLAARGTRRLVGRAGDLVTLLPFGGPAAGIRTHGLRYPLRDETLEVGPARGLSNVRTRPEARLTFQGGRILVIETPVTVRP